MSASWIVNVGGRAYGPYSDAQMAAFVAEGRLVPQSLIARAGENAFRSASQEPALAMLFAAAPASPTPEVQTPRSDPGQIFGRNKDETQKNGERAHVVIIADMKSGSISGLEEEIYKLGQAYPLFPQVWLLRTEQSVNTVRNQLVQQLGKLDVLFVVDATNNKAAWFNFGPEADARIRRIWMRGPDPQSTLRAAG
ncbi:MAG: GYF domain-containing protein [Rhizomicrobium sp.]